MSRRIDLSPDFHAEPGETPHHQHDVYTTKWASAENPRQSVGTLTRAAVEAWREANKNAKHWHKIADRRAKKLMDQVAPSSNGRS